MSRSSPFYLFQKIVSGFLSDFVDYQSELPKDHSQQIVHSHLMRTAQKSMKRRLSSLHALLHDFHKKGEREILDRVVVGKLINLYSLRIRIMSVSVEDSAQILYDFKYGELNEGNELHDLLVRIEELFSVLFNQTTLLDLKILPVEPRLTSPRVFPNEHFQGVLGRIVKKGKSCCTEQNPQMVPIYSDNRKISRRGRFLYSASNYTANLSSDPGSATDLCWRSHRKDNTSEIGDFAISGGPYSHKRSGSNRHTSRKKNYSVSNSESESETPVRVLSNNFTKKYGKFFNKKSKSRQKSSRNNLLESGGSSVSRRDNSNKQGVERDIKSKSRRNKPLVVSDDDTDTENETYDKSQNSKNRIKSRGRNFQNAARPKGAKGSLSLSNPNKMGLPNKDISKMDSEESSRNDNRKSKGIANNINEPPKRKSKLTNLTRSGDNDRNKTNKRSLSLNNSKRDGAGGEAIKFVGKVKKSYSEASFNNNEKNRPKKLVPSNDRRKNDTSNRNYKNQNNSNQRKEINKTQTDQQVQEIKNPKANYQNNAKNMKSGADVSRPKNQNNSTSLNNGQKIVINPYQDQNKNANSRGKSNSKKTSLDHGEDNNHEISAMQRRKTKNSYDKDRKSDNNAHNSHDLQNEMSNIERKKLENSHHQNKLSDVSKNSENSRKSSTQRPKNDSFSSHQNKNQENSYLHNEKDKMASYQSGDTATINNFTMSHNRKDKVDLYKKNNDKNTYGRQTQNQPKNELGYNHMKNNEIHNTQSRKIEKVSQNTHKNEKSHNKYNEVEVSANKHKNFNKNAKNSNQAPLVESSYLQTHRNEVNRNNEIQKGQRLNFQNNNLNKNVTPHLQNNLFRRGMLSPQHNKNRQLYKHMEKGGGGDVRQARHLIGGSNGSESERDAESSGRNKQGILYSKLMLNERKNGFDKMGRFSEDWSSGDIFSDVGDGDDTDLSTWELATNLIKKPIPSLLATIPPPSILISYTRKRYPRFGWPMGAPDGRRYYPNGTLFCASFPNGSSQVYYPHGGLAILVSSPNPTHQIIVFRDPYEGFYFLDKSVLAQFNTVGTGVVYNSQGTMLVRYNLKGGYQVESENKIKGGYSWAWTRAGSRLLQKLNRYLTLRISDIESIHLVFYGNKRGVRLNIGLHNTINLIALHPAYPNLFQRKTLNDADFDYKTGSYKYNGVGGSSSIGQGGGGGGGGFCYASDSCCNYDNLCCCPPCPSICHVPCSMSHSNCF